ncbi:hypothetical protein GCM10023186_22240 [Hymenobacter koreensis]|uniref:Uncharacterized protein n=1 Tax=Hymenobacter koreensis TaxID=1084523 RepID=A0ABP8IZM4_9BACT
MAHCSAAAGSVGVVVGTGGGTKRRRVVQMNGVADGLRSKTDTNCSVAASENTGSCNCWTKTFSAADLISAR